MDDKTAKSLNNSQSVFRALAILLILNSHLDGFWGNKFAAGGGSAGNIMFFYISGLSLLPQVINICDNTRRKCGQDRHSSKFLRIWFLKRIFRLYRFSTKESHPLSK